MTVLTGDAAETSTWTPGLEFGGGNVGMTEANEGWYRKEGSLIHAWGVLSLTTKGSSTGTATITGLPYTSATRALAGVGAPGGMWTMANLGGTVTFWVGSASTTINLRDTATVGSYNLDDTNFANGSLIYFSISYEAA